LERGKNLCFKRRNTDFHIFLFSYETTLTFAINQSIYNFSDGTITANASKPLRDGYALVYSNNTSEGMSGGAVLNEKGELIGATSELKHPSLKREIPTSEHEHSSLKREFPSSELETR
jgi:hypothetical protein